MSDGFPSKPRILRGAFVEFGLSLPPLFVVFQFNPVQLTRNRGLTFAVPGTPGQQPGGGQAPAALPRTLRQFHGEVDNLLDLQKKQLVTVGEQTIGFDIRLDATDKLDEGDALTEQFGIAPQLSTLELMVYPKSESLLGRAVDRLLGKPKGFSFTRSTNPPLILFVFGRKRVLPVNITSMNITETEFSADLNPIRATVGVNLTVIEGNSVPYLYSKAMTEAMSVLNLASVADIANVAVPG
ncbi:hypothetical protein [Amycolatopsis sp. NPDC051128]|uniref:hypothetical protein n=1 Tax=Amycolatopsis sp. NPDC051128 TaxID=3155412 RepID=UPI0034236036